MADSLNTVNVVALTEAADLKDGDTLLLIRDDGQGNKPCYRIEGRSFRGKSAYEVAKENGYTGTESDWAEQAAKVANFDVDFDPSDGSLVFTK